MSIRPTTFIPLRSRNVSGETPKEFRDRSNLENSFALDDFAEDLDGQSSLGRESAEFNSVCKLNVDVPNPSLDSATQKTSSEENFEKFREEQQREVDRISLELLSNTKHYKKYIAKNHPEERLKQVANKSRFLKYKSRVAALFIELLDEYEDLEESSTLVNIELQSMFKECVQKTIQHLEWSEHNQNTRSSEFEEDDDVMFASKPAHNKRRGKQHSAAADPFSYWGATIRKSEDQHI